MSVRFLYGFLLFLLHSIQGIAPTSSLRRISSLDRGGWQGRTKTVHRWGVARQTTPTGKTVLTSSVSPSSLLQHPFPKLTSSVAVQVSSTSTHTVATNQTHRCRRQWPPRLRRWFNKRPGQVPSPMPHRKHHQWIPHRPTRLRAPTTLRMEGTLEKLPIQEHLALRTRPPPPTPWNASRPLHSPSTINRTSKRRMFKQRRWTTHLTPHPT